MLNLTKRVAYFTMEAGITSRFKNYSGGLGILSGDHIKQATDDNANTDFISILWKKGYNLQKVDNGNVVDTEQNNENWLEFVEDLNLSFNLLISGKEITIKVWKFKGHRLYLLDSDLDCNGDLRYLTYKLYGGYYEDLEWERIAQEIILGIGGMFAAQKLNLNPEYYHFNDGHAIFAVHKIIKDFMDYGLAFEDAITKTKEVVRFTTHTNVPAGNELHNIEDLIKYNASYGLSYEQLLRLGGNPYGMTVAALRTSGKVNAVSELHAIKANILWQNIIDRPEIFAITNGVHKPTWQNSLISETLLKNKEEIFEAHLELKRKLINFVFEKKQIKLDENSLIIGFARRATGYKRWDLVFKDAMTIDYLIKTNNIQLVFAGRSHQKDETGKKYIKIIHEMSIKYPNNVVFLEGYDIEIGKIVTSGSDIWLNTPGGELEACGTSGMKAALNGVLNFSAKDGWWYESCKHEVNGWEIHNHCIDNECERDRKDAESLIWYLCSSVVPRYYNEDKTVWKQMMMCSIQTAQYFTTKRMLADYYAKLYV
jgi:glycogen phosphorylase